MTWVMRACPRPAAAFLALTELTDVYPATADANPVAVLPAQGIGLGARILAFCAGGVGLVGVAVRPLCSRARR